MNNKDLSSFEKEISELYTKGKIKGPIHLRNSNERELIEIFKNITPEDYVFSTWANHLHALLKKIPPDLIKQRILDGESMAMNFPKYNFYTSAIVGGICPIATGVAFALKKQQKVNRVFIFIGDMSSQTGIANESIRYSINHDLPITWVIEDNGKSVSTPTEEAWQQNTKDYIDYFIDSCKNCNNTEILYYKFNSTYPHSGVGVFVSF